MPRSGKLPKHSSGEFVFQRHYHHTLYLLYLCPAIFKVKMNGTNTTQRLAGHKQRTNIHAQSPNLPIAEWPIHHPQKVYE
jgi:hypothetical protein